MNNQQTKEDAELLNYLDSYITEEKETKEIQKPKTESVMKTPFSKYANVSEAKPVSDPVQPVVDTGGWSLNAEIQKAPINSEFLKENLPVGEYYIEVLKITLDKVIEKLGNAVVCDVVFKILDGEYANALKSHSWFVRQNKNGVLTSNEYAISKFKKFLLDVGAITEEDQTVNEEKCSLIYGRQGKLIVTKQGEKYFKLEFKFNNHK